MRRRTAAVRSIRQDRPSPVYPWVIVGQNESIAWGLTTTVMDFSDVYIETLVKDAGGNPTGVMFRGEEVPFIRTPVHHQLQRRHQ